MTTLREMLEHWREHDVTVGALAGKRGADPLEVDPVMILAREQAICQEVCGPAATLVEEGLQVDGAHHKQWYLERVLLALGLDPAAVNAEPGVAP